MGVYKVEASSRPVGMQVLTQVRDHSFLQDEPVRSTGTDAGPNPVEMLLSALSGCLTITAEDISKRRQDIDVKDFHVETTGQTLRFADGSSKVVGIQVHMTAATNLNADQQQAFFKEVIRQCTVHASIEAGIPIEFTY